MAKNDTILIDGIIDDRIELKLPSEKRDEAFEFFAFEQILKDYDLSIDDLQSGNVDGQNDGGIDGFFILVNGHNLSDPKSFQWPRTGSFLEVWVITCKHHATFKQAPVDNLVASVMELFDFTLENENLKGDYSNQILRKRENLKFAYRKVSPRLTKFSINFCYASRGNRINLGDSILSRANQTKQIVQDFFGNCTSDFQFLGSTELIELHRKIPNFTLELPFSESLSSGQSYILLVNLKDYFSFVTDSGKLRRYLFDSNVRDFAGLNRVNEDIRDTLSDNTSPDFWWLNNGVTILATAAQTIGKSIVIEDIQIVNGLQSTESLYRHFQTGGSDINNRSIMVKIIVSKEENIRDLIIRATNNQTTVELSSLHATDKIQRDIEDVLKRSGFYYERRTNFYKNQGISADKILTPLYVAAGFLSLILKAPHHATILKSKFMRSDNSYEKIFSSESDLKVWPQIAFILKKTDLFIESLRPSRQGGERFLKTRRQFVSFLTVSRILGTFNFNIYDLINMDIAKYDTHELVKTWELFNKESKSFMPIRSVAKKHYFINLCELATNNWNIKGLERMTKGVKFSLRNNNNKNSNDKVQVSMDFALKVNSALPKQPWKPGIHNKVIAELGCTKKEYFESVKILINEGLRNEQKDGVVYDFEGNVLCFDKDRVDSVTLHLKNTD